MRYSHHTWRELVYYLRTLWYRTDQNFSRAPPVAYWMSELSTLKRVITEGLRLCEQRFHVTTFSPCTNLSNGIKIGIKLAHSIRSNIKVKYICIKKFPNISLNIYMISKLLIRTKRENQFLSFFGTCKINKWRLLRRWSSRLHKNVPPIN